MCVQTSIFANVWSEIIQVLYNFNPLEVVGRGGETQFEVGENWRHNWTKIIKKSIFLFWPHSILI